MVYGFGFGELFLRFRVYVNCKIGGHLGFRVYGLGFRVEGV